MGNGQYISRSDDSDSYPFTNRREEYQSLSSVMKAGQKWGRQLCSINGASSQLTRAWRFSASLQTTLFIPRSTCLCYATQFHISTLDTTPSTSLKLYTFELPAPPRQTVHSIKMPRTLDTLPEEILDLIAGFVDKKSLCSLARTSQKFCRVAVRHIYRDIDLIIRVRDNHSIPWTCHLGILMRSKPHLASLVRSFSIRRSRGWIRSQEDDVTSEDSNILITMTMMKATLKRMTITSLMTRKQSKTASSKTFTMSFYPAIVSAIGMQTIF